MLDVNSEFYYWDLMFQERFGITPEEIWRDERMEKMNKEIKRSLAEARSYQHKKPIRYFGYLRKK